MSALPDSPLSLWLDTYGPYTAQPPLRDDVSCDVAIVGGGFTGLATAIELKRADPGLDVSLLEAKEIGYGASGRNGSFAMTVVGLGFGTMAMLRGKEFVRRAHIYMMRAVDYLEDSIRRERLDCDCLRPGFLRVATTPSHVKRLRQEVSMMNELGFDDLFWLDAADAQQRVCSSHYMGAMWEPRMLLVNPAKLVRQEKLLAQRLGVTIYEHTPVGPIRRREGGAFWLRTAEGSVTAEKIVLATNAYSHLFDTLRRKQVPAFTYMIATEPLTPEQLGAIGWHGREGVEDSRNLVHYYRLTPDNRLVIGGGPVGLTVANRLDADSDHAAWRHLEEHIGYLFPALKGIGVSHRWGGPFSVTMDLTPALGYLGDRRAVYSLGCIGHGVSTSHLNGLVLRDLLLEQSRAEPACPFVNRRVIPWPAEPFRIAAAAGLRAYLQVEDWLHERPGRHVRAVTESSTP
jgi:glycine/D-amino acid oxidase-like deaminating enzyme